MDTFIEILGYLPVVEAVPYFFLMYIATIARMVKTKSSNDVSLIAWIANFVVYALYIFYGIFIVKEWKYIASITLATTGNLAVLVTIIILRIKNKMPVGKTTTKKTTIEKTGVAA